MNVSDNHSLWIISCANCLQALSVDPLGYLMAGSLGSMYQRGNGGLR